MTEFFTTSITTESFAFLPLFSFKEKVGDGYLRLTQRQVRSPLCLFLYRNTQEKADAESWLLTAAVTRVGVSSSVNTGGWLSDGRVMSLFRVFLFKGAT